MHCSAYCLISRTVGFLQLRLIVIPSGFGSYLVAVGLQRIADALLRFAPGEPEIVAVLVGLLGEGLHQRMAIDPGHAEYDPPACGNNR